MRIAKTIIGLVLGLSFSAAASACPDGYYEMCIVPSPFGCIKTGCIPNGGTIVGGASDALAELNDGVIHLGNEIVHTSQGVGSQLSSVASRIDWPKVDTNALITATLIAEAIANGAACIASEGSSPGYSSSGGGTVVCSANSCACSALCLALAVKLRTNMSPEEKEKTDDVVNNPKYAELLKQHDADVTKDLKRLGWLRKSSTPSTCTTPGHRYCN